MANKTNKETRTSIDELNENLTSVEQKVESNPKIILWTIVGIVIIALAILGYMWWNNSNTEKSTAAIGAADLIMVDGNDSIALQKYQAIANEFNDKNGSRAALESAIILYQQGKYQDAINYIEKASFSDMLIAASAKSLKGDCLVNLGEKNYEAAISCYSEAAKIAEGNAQYAPLFLMKKATVLDTQKKYTEAKVVYESIQKDYPEFESTFGVSLDEYIANESQKAGE